MANTKLKKTKIKITQKELTWKLRFKDLVAFKKIYHHTDVPARYPENKELGHWVVRQRAHQKILTEERIAKLNSIDFIWNYAEYTWNRKYEALVEFYNEHGHCNVDYSDRAHDELANWIIIQRSAFKTNASSLTRKRLKKLNLINFDWGRLDVKWERNFKRLKEFKKKYKHTAVPYRWSEDRILSNWVNGLRRKKKTLSPDKVKKLDSLGFLWAISRKEKANFKISK